MFDTIKAISDPSKVTDEQITKAYDMLKDYCKENNTDVLTLVNNDENISLAAKKIHSELGWIVRKTISVEKIEKLITENIDFIRGKAQEQYDLENPKKTKGKAKTKKNT